MINKVFSFFRGMERTNETDYTNSSKENVKDKKSKKIKEIFSNLPSLETDRLILRKVLPSDYEDMYEYSSDAEVTKYLTWYPHKTPGQTKEYVDYLQAKYAEGKFYDWGIEYKDNHKFIGTCGFTSINIPHNKAEIGYVMSRRYWGRSLMPEAAREVLKFGFETLFLNKIEARFIDGNIKSCSVMKKIGMSYENTLFEAFHVKSEYKTVHTFSISRNTYLSMQRI